ncbi:MalY/PatB family protein [Pseudoramibacter faecis]|uniref:MalY/PatB family protein n=1 Tax=Pseudoramibacter faecis TaxID=3108534 RepID=UPI002E762545|nr:aminotransferase class I/II-fold pyridoxal phosphate-dependent enzyme [Pseudoramibacter sp. HA2172]
MYNFDEMIDRRNTNALNTDGFRGYIFHAGPEKVFPYKDEAFVRMWVADMEFGIAPEILDALRARIDRRIFGYTGVFDNSYYESVVKWCKDHYGWVFPQEELCYSPGIIPALYQLAETLCTQEEKVLIHTPAYGYFLHAAEYSNLGVLESPLPKNEKGEFFIDYDHFEKQCADPHCKLIFWCNPQNPTGRVWKEDELKRIAGIVEKYNLWIISDEIHCDLIRQGQVHTPLAKIMPDYPKLITCMAPTKTFNMAGLSFSNIIIRDPELRETFRKRDKLFGMVNTMSLTAAKAAYDFGDPWLQELRVYLDGNFAFVKAFLAEHMPEAVMNISEATYLSWVDLSKVLPDVADLPGFFANRAGVLLEGGNALFVGNAEGYIRLNLAMPRAVIKTGLERMRDAVNAHKAQRDNH